MWCLGDSWYSAHGAWVLREPVTVGHGEQGAQRSPRGLRGAALELKADLRADGSRKMFQGRLVASIRACRRPRGQSPESWGRMPENHPGGAGFSG